MIYWSKTGAFCLATQTGKEGAKQVGSHTHELISSLESTPGKFGQDQSSGFSKLDGDEQQTDVIFISFLSKMAKAMSGFI